jgi:hypothetical protein
MGYAISVTETVPVVALDSEISEICWPGVTVKYSPTEVLAGR